MIKKQMICRRCGKRFTAEVLEPGEAEEKRVTSRAVTCPECGGPAEAA